MAMDPVQTKRTTLNRWLREPLLHFLIGGGLLFALYGALNRGAGEASPTARMQGRAFTTGHQLHLQARQQLPQHLGAA